MIGAKFRRAVRNALALVPYFSPALAGERWRIVGALMLSLGVVVLEILRPWPVKILFDRFILRDPAGQPIDTGALAAVLCAIVAIPAVIGQLGLLRTVLSAEVGRRVTTRLRRRLFDHLQRLDLTFHHRQRQGDLLMRLTGDVNMLRDLLFASWIQIISRGTLLIGIALVMGILAPDLALVAGLPSVLLLALLARSSRRLRKTARAQREKEGDAAALAGETLHQIALVKSLAVESEITRRFARMSRSGERAGLRAARAAGASERLSEWLTGIGLAALLALGAYRVVGGTMSAGELLVFVSYARTLFKPLRGLAKEGIRLGKAAACAQRVLEILRLEPEPAEGCPAPAFRGEVTFAGVTFSHAGREPTFTALDLEIPAGVLAVLSGPNGAGKSTLANLVLRLHRPSTGAILVDGRDIRDFELTSYRSRCAYVPQDIRLFATSIEDNIRLGKPDASATELVAAAEAAYLDPVLARLPDGLATEVGESGVALSGGEARRVMLARAAIRDARILVLDEPLSGIDEASRPMVTAAIRRLAVGRTTLVITHDSAEAFQPDMEIFVTDGRVTILTPETRP